MKSVIFYICVLNTLWVYSQKQYPKNYFRSPLDIPIVLSGTFGELRNNHFHSGLDIKTQRKNGLPIYAVADGYVSRIKVALWGYGKALYITHPNGYTSVYAHLSKFGDGIEDFIKKIQYKKESYETGNVYLQPGQIPVKKGQIVAFSGDTGGYVAPHLHFEIRDTKTEHIINPMHFGYLPKDSIAPRFQKLMVYPLNETTRINQSSSKTLLPLRRQHKNTYITNRIYASGTIGFGVHVFDRLNGALNKNGIYSLEMLVNGKQVYYHDLETFSFAESKLINLLIDYPYFATYKNRLQKTHRVPANTLSIYEKLLNDGQITIQPGFNYSVQIKARDFMGNTSTIKIPIKGVDPTTAFIAKDTTAYKVKATKFNKFTVKHVTVAFPKNTFYQDYFLDLKVNKGIAHIHKPTIPLDRRYTLTFDVSMYSDIEKKHLYIANLNNKRYPRYQKTVKKEHKFYTTTKVLGTYGLKKDTSTPTIALVNFKDQQWVSKLSYLKVRIDDKGSGIKSYRGTIDGEWILMEYNLKKKQLIYNFRDKPLVGSKHTFTIEVIDNVGNTKMRSVTFYRK